MFPVHARLILATGLAYPRALEATVPAPAEGSNATIQLKLMGLRDGAGWTMKALQAGRVDGKDLKVRAGVLALHSIAVVGPRQILGGAETCKVEYRVRWELPEGDREIWEVKSLVDLRPPKGMEAAAPGQELRRQTLLVYRSWHWELADGSSREIGRRDAARWAWLTWLI